MSSTWQCCADIFLILGVTAYQKKQRWKMCFDPRSKGTNTAMQKKKKSSSKIAVEMSQSYLRRGAKVCGTVAPLLQRQRWL